MQTLILKRNAAGDVVRTTTLLNKLPGEVTWVTDAVNVELIDFGPRPVRVYPWESRNTCLDTRYDLLINLEDSVETADFAARVNCSSRFGAYLNGEQAVAYTDDSREWFDMSLISVYGKAKADELKLRNRRTFQEIVFDGLGWQFRGEPYVISAPVPTELRGDVAIAPVAGPVWPMKGWAHYEALKSSLEARGLKVNVLPRRSSLREHIGDIGNHKVLVGGDSLPMHLALGIGVRCVTLFNCTSPWEIYDYGIQNKLLSPLLTKYFYSRAADSLAMRAIQLTDVLEAVMESLGAHRRTTPTVPLPAGDTWRDAGPVTPV